LWLKCGHSNHHPGIIAGYYLESVTNVGGYPSRLRTDLGTENVLIAAIQAFVAGSQQAHVYGTSPGNQRIEAWWSFYRRLRSQFEVVCAKRCEASVEKESVLMLMNLWQNIKTPYLAPFPK